MKFTVQPAIDQSKCSNPNMDTTAAVLFKTNDTCLKRSPAHGKCDTESNSITETTSSGGASIEVILGGIPEGNYPIQVTSEGLSDTFNLHTHPFGNCDGDHEPSKKFFITYVYPADQYGHNIDAGVVGSSMLLRARIYFLREGKTKKKVKIECTESRTGECKIIVGRIF